MPEKPLVKIERRGRVGAQEFNDFYVAMEERLETRLVAPQIPTERLAVCVSKNVITPDSAPVPDCMTCGACCNFATCVPVSPADAVSAEHYWEIMAHGTSAPVVVERFLRRETETGNCSALKGKLGERVTCTIYQTRPSTCRKFEAGSDRCHAVRRMYDFEEPLSEQQVAEALAKLPPAPSAAGKITYAAIVPEKIQARRPSPAHPPAGQGAASAAAPRDDAAPAAADEGAAAGVICRVYVLVDDSPVEIHSYDPSEESWLQHEFQNLTLDEARDLISARKNGAGRDA